MTARYLLRFGPLGYLALLLVLPVRLVFYRTFQHGLQPGWAAVTNPVAPHPAPLTTFRRITLPAIRWAVGYGVVLTTARAIGEFGAVSIVSGRIEGKTETLPLYVQSQFEGFNTTGAFAACVVLALIALATVLAMRMFRPKEAAASLSMPSGGRGGFAGTAVLTRLSGRKGLKLDDDTRRNA